MEQRTRTRLLRPADWPIFYKILLGVVAVVMLALGVTTYVYARILQADLREEIGLEFETLASAQMNHLADIFSEQLTLLQSIALIDLVKVRAALRDARYHGDQAAIEARLLDLDQQWRAAADDDILVQAIVNPQLNSLASQLLDHQETFPDHVEIFLTDRYGGLVAATGRTSDYYQADEEWWQAAYNEGRGAFYIGQPEYDESAGYTALNMAAPIFAVEGNEVVGVARTTFRVDAIYEAVNRLQFGQTGHVTIIDSAGLVISDPHPEYLGEQMPPSWSIPDILATTSGWREMEGKEGVPVLAGYAAIFGAEIEHEDEAEAIQALGWVLFVHQAQSEAYAPVAGAIRTGFLATGVFALVAAGLAFVIARMTVTPINNLVGVARQMAAGDLSAQAPVQRHDETGLLAEAFNTMASQLRELVEQLEQRVAARTQRLEIVAILSERLSAILDLEELLAEVVNQVKNNFDYYHAHIYLLDDQRTNLVMAAGTGAAGEKMKAQEHHIPLDAPASLVARAARSGEIVSVDNVRHVEDWLPNPLLPDTYSEMAVPIILAGQVVGVLDVQQDDIAGLDEGDANLLRSLANQVAIGIRNARLFAEVESALAEARAAQERYVAQSWQERDTSTQRREYYYTGPGATPPDETRQPVLAEARQQALTRDRAAIITLEAGESEKPGPNEALVAPVTLRGQTIGSLRLHSGGEGQPWQEDDLEMIRAVTDRLAQTAEQIRLFGETRERASYEQLVGEITQKLRQAPTLEVLAQIAAQELSNSLGVSRGLVKVGGLAPVADDMAGNGDEGVKISRS